MLIERLTDVEAERLRAVRLRSLEDAPDAFGTRHADAAGWPPSRWVEQLAELATFVAVVDGQDAGLARGGAHSERADGAILLSMWVAPEARGRGVGEALIDAVADWARTRGFRRLFLDVADRNDAAIALYARKGFEPTGERGHLPPPREHVTEHERMLEL